MLPILATFQFLSQGFIAVALITFIVLRGRAQDRWPGWRGWLIAAGAGATLAIVAATAAMVPWMGPWLITSYAVMLVIGFLAAFHLARKRLAADVAGDFHVSRIALICLVLGMAGARARYVWENWGMFHDDQGIAWRTIIDLDRGGMVWYGGLIAAIIGSALYARWHKLPVLLLADGVAMPVCIGLAIGRIGCFLNGCCSGRPTDLPWGVVFPTRDEAARHPTQLYETLAALVLGLALWWFGRRPRPAGLTAALFCIGYGGWRFANEILRDDYRNPGTVSDLGGFVLTNSQATSLLLIVFGCVLATWTSMRPGAGKSGSPEVRK